jgi:hypothetical protein
MGRNRCCGASMKPTWQVMSTVRAFAPFSPTIRLSAAQVARNEVLVDARLKRRRDQHEAVHEPIE